MKLNTIIFIKLLLLQIILNPVYGQKKTADTTLKAILIIGRKISEPASAIEKMDKIADLLTKNRVKVYKFYYNNANWQNIIKVSKDCSFFIYYGHGGRLGDDNNFGGFFINTDITASQILSELKLKENALVIFKSVCGGAGFSADDRIDIGTDEAKKRVCSYASPFFKIGSAAYYANNIS